MIFMDCIWFFTIYPKMYKLFKIFLALERDKELIKPWKCDQLWYFRGEGNRTNYDVSYETGISMKTLEILSFKFIVLMFSLISHEICMLDGSIYSTFLHWISRLPDWKVCIAQPRSRLRNFFWAGAQTRKIQKHSVRRANFESARAKNENCVIIQAQRARFEIAQFSKRA